MLRRDRADRALDHGGIDLDPAIVEKDGEAGPVLEREADRLGDAEAA